MMKKDKLEELIEQTINEEYKELDVVKNVSVPDFNETMKEFRSNLEKEEKNNQLKKKSFLMKLGYKKFSATAALLAFLVIGSMSLGLNGKLNIFNNTKQESVGEENGVQIPNPLKTVNSIEELEKACGFRVEEVTYVPEGYEKDELIYIDITDEDKVARQLFIDEDDEKIEFEKHSDKLDIKGDWNVYDKEEKIEINDLKVTLHYINNEIFKATWNQDGFKYDIFSSKSIDKSEVIKIINNLK